VYVVEIERSFEVGLGRSCKEVQATIKSQDGICLFYYRNHRGKDKDIVVAFPACKRFQLGGGICHCAGIDIFQFDAIFGSLFWRVERCCTIQTALIDIGYYQQPRFPVFAVDGVIDCCQSHRTDTCQNCHATSVSNLHLVNIRSGGDVVVGMHGSDYA